VSVTEPVCLIPDDPSRGPFAAHPSSGVGWCQTALVITVVGEALIDLVIDPAGTVTAALGGAPFNTARACGRLGADVGFVGALSNDRFGTMLRAQLEDDGVDVSDAPVVDAPTTLAAAELDAHGAASYRFYIDGTSAPALMATPTVDDGGVVFTGGLGLVLEPMATTVETLVSGLPPSTILVVDVNCRPLVVPDRQTYVDRARRVVGAADLVKVSDDDLAYLSPGVDPVDAAHRLLELGPSAVLVTGGGAGVHVVTTDGERHVAVEPVVVVDTIGAGDTFGGALMAWLTANEVAVSDLGDLDVLVRAVRAANVAAGGACTRRGADPPRLADLPEGWTR